MMAKKSMRPNRIGCALRTCCGSQGCAELLVFMTYGIDVCHCDGECLG